MIQRRSDSRQPPQDQADGLRRLFAGPGQHVLPLVANPFVPASGALIEVAAAALVASGRQVLVVDAASNAAAPRETALFDLAGSIDTLSPGLGYLAARGLPLAHVDSRGSAAAFVDAIAAASPAADVVLLHADPSDMARLLAGRPARPVLLCAERLEAVKQAYAAAKLLVRRAGTLRLDLLLSARTGSARTQRVIDSIAGCVDTFIGALVVATAAIEPLADPDAADDPALQQLLAAQLRPDDPHTRPRGPASCPPVAPGSAPGRHDGRTRALES
jgi:hypothetical protein